MWLSAFPRNYPPSASILKCLLDAGCDINETTVNHPDVPDGWNCLFLLVLRAEFPDSSEEFETLRYTIKQRVNIFAKDASGLTVFDHVNAPPNDIYSGYRRDLWYCALWREGIDTRSLPEKHPHVAEYSIFYRLEDFRALCYLDTWTRADVAHQVHEALTAWDAAYLDTEEATLRLSLIREEEELRQDRR